MKMIDNTKPMFNPYKPRKKQPPMISMLLNAVHFFLDCAFIIHAAGTYRLVVLHVNNVLLDKSYTSLKGAKIGFNKIYSRQACTENVNARWAEYTPNTTWMEKKAAILARADKSNKSDKPAKNRKIGDMSKRDMIKGKMMVTEVCHG